MWDIYKDYMIAFLGVLFLGIPLMGTLWNQRRKSIDRKKRKYLMAWLIAAFVGCVLLTWLGFDKVHRDNKQNQDNAFLNVNLKNTREQLAHSDSLNVILTKTIDSTNTFMRDLKTSFGIVKDANNKPVKYETRINTARDVYIGDRKN
jgi:hypothetical protein